MNKHSCNTSVERKCIKCKDIKPLTSDYFHKDKNRPHGFMYKCKDCEKQRVDNRTWKQKKAGMSAASKEKQKLAKEAYRNTLVGKARQMVGAYRLTDKKKGFTCDLTHFDMLKAYESKCSYCTHPATGYDRIDNTKGHLKTNCIPCCGDCNTAKMNHFSYDEMLIIGAAIKEVKDARKNRLN